MERERLTRLLSEPSHVAKEDLAGLQALSERYPWFSAAHLLLAVGEHASGDVLYDERVRTAAAHLPQRSVLFDLVHGDQPADVPMIPVQEVHVEVPVPPPLTIVSRAPEATAPVIALEPEPAPMIPEAVAPASTPEPGQVPEPAIPAAITPAAEQPEEEADPLDLMIRQAAMASGYELVMEHALPEAPAPAPVPDLPPPAVIAAVPSTPTAEVPSAILAPAPAPVPAPAPTGRLRFTDWLSVATEEAAPAPPVAKLSTAATHEDWLYSKPAPASAVEQPPVPAPAPLLDPLTLIDRFIKQEHPEPPKRAEFFTPQQAAKRSLEDHAELVTETLARIYEKQGNIPKAITAYKRLAERQPDKREYYLGLAKALEGRGKA